MTLLFLDTNPLIRFLTQDAPEQAARARALFERAAKGELTLYVSESVVVEMVNVLSSRATYNLARAEVERHLLNIFSLRGFRIPHQNTYRRALQLWVATPQVRDFVDLLSVAQMERLKIPTIASFDQDFDRFPQIRRLEP
jgi:predicted nucleic acid-binding protein